MAMARTVVFLTALLAVGLHKAAAEETKSSRDRQLDLTEKVMVGGRRALLNTGGRDKFLKHSYVEAIEAMLKEQTSDDKVMGRRILQVQNPVQTCALTPLIVQAQVTGVSFADIANLFLEILLQTYANTPSGFTLFPQGGNRQQQICALARVRLQSLIAAQAQTTAG